MTLKNFQVKASQPSSAHSEIVQAARKGLGELTGNKLPAAFRTVKTAQKRGGGGSFKQAIIWRSQGKGGILGFLSTLNFSSRLWRSKGGSISSNGLIKAHISMSCCHFSFAASLASSTPETKGSAGRTRLMQPRCCSSKTSSKTPALGFWGSGSPKPHTSTGHQLQKQLPADSSSLASFWFPFQGF